MNMANLPDLLTVRQASTILNVHPNTLRNWEKDGSLSAVRIGSRRDRRFPKAAIMSILGTSNQTAN